MGKTSTNSQKKDRTGLLVGLVCLGLALVIAFTLTANSIVTNNRRNSVSVTTTNYEIKNSTVAYFYGSVYQNFLSTYSDYISYIGLDTTVSRKNQQSMSGDSTWFEYFLTSTRAQMKQVIVMAEAAKAEGLSLSDEDKESIDTYIDSMKAYAAMSGYSFSGYLNASFGDNGVTEDVLREAMELEFLSNMYYEKYNASLKYTDDDYDKYYEENKNSFLYMDYKSYKINVEPEEDTDEAKKAADEEAKAFADKLAAATSEDEFDSILRDYLTALEAEKDATADDSEKEDKDPVETAINNSLVTSYPYSSSSEIGKWGFADGREVGDTTIIDGDDYYTVCMMVKTPYRIEDLTKNIRRIIIDTNKYESEDDAKAKADEILATFKEGDMTGEEFAKLAVEYSNDTSVDTTGGLYENYVLGDVATGLDDWAADENRKVGDAEVIENSDYGYEVVFYESDGIETWKENAREILMATDYEKKVEELATQYEYTEIVENYNKLDA